MVLGIVQVQTDVRQTESPAANLFAILELPNSPTSQRLLHMLCPYIHETILCFRLFFCVNILNVVLLLGVL